MDTTKLTMILSAAKPGLSNQEKQFSMELLAMANTFPKKYSPQQRLRFAKKLMSSLLKTSYKNWDKLKPQSRELAAALVKQGIVNEAPQNWNPGPGSSYTSAPQVNPNAKNKVNQVSSVSYSDCVARKKVQGYPPAAGQAELECLQELGGFRDTALNNQVYHQTTSGDSISTTKISPALPKFNNQGPTTPSYYGKRKSALERAKESLVRAMILEKDIRNSTKNIIRSASLSRSLKRESYFSKDKPQIKSAVESEISDIPAWYRTRAGTMRDLVPSKSSIKSGSNKSSDLSFLVTRQFLLDGNYRDQVVTPQLENTNRKILSASTDKTPAFLRVRQHVTSKIGGM